VEKALHGSHSPISTGKINRLESCSSNGEKPNLLKEGTIRLLFDLFAIFLPTWKNLAGNINALKTRHFKEFYRAKSSTLSGN
jgi:hypothetical protein